jgi:hypothetical protein
MKQLKWNVQDWVAFLKQPDALAGRAPPKKIKNIYFELLLIHL